jgi:ketosteroid isomerase-like protein
MNEQENASVVRQVYENLRKRDIQSLLNLLSEDVECELSKMKGIPLAGKRNGREHVAEFFKSMAQRRSDLAACTSREMESLSA